MGAKDIAMDAADDTVDLAQQAAFDHFWRQMIARVLKEWRETDAHPEFASDRQPAAQHDSSDAA
jgi:hypothetical protein